MIRIEGESYYLLLVVDDGQVTLRMSYSPFGNPPETIGDGENGLGCNSKQKVITKTLLY
jgi:hypothetical protein